MTKKILIVLVLMLIIPFGILSCNGEKSATPAPGSNTGINSDPAIVPSQPEEPVAKEPVKEAIKEETPKENLEVGIREGNLAPDFSLYDLEGEEVKLSDFRGKVVMLNFWATWCYYCKKEMPSMETFYQNYKDKGLVILAVNVREDQGTVNRFIKEKNYTFPILLDRTGAIAKEFQVGGLPITYIIDKRGVMSKIIIGGPINWQNEKYSRLITDLLEK